MRNVLYFVAAIGFFLQVTRGQKWDIKKMEQCPCAGDIREGFLDSVATYAQDIGNGQALRLRLWQLESDKCTAHVVDKSPKPGEIEISMKYRGSIIIEEPGQDDGTRQQGEELDSYPDIQVQYGGARPGFGPQQEVDNGQQQEVDNGQQQDNGFLQDTEIADLLGGLDIDQVQQSLNNGQLQQGADIGQDVDTTQEQSQQSNDSSSGIGTDMKNYSAEFSFIVDVDTGKLSSPAAATTRKRRRREIMPLDNVTIKIGIDFLQKPNIDVRRLNEQINSVLRTRLNDYWLPMAFCLLGVTQ